MTKKSTDIRKKEIIDIARDLIVHQGTKALTIKNLSTKMKLSEPALYRHFKNKRAILTALIEDFEGTLIEGIKNSISLQSAPLDQLKEIMRAHLLLSERKKGIFFAITSESIHFQDKVLTKRVLEVVKNYQSQIKEILEVAKTKKNIRGDTDLEAASLAFFGLIQTCIILYALTNYTVFPLNKMESLWDIFIRGIQS
ncbi:MAG: TetR/AcrR family transcriptional regulator [Candidatus Omnitrophica bacterium]|nr:TetR/AcrR family transcriptional regulator [Candidatus Omnitrophota bacterium]